eukprot:3757471-Alexandrium_andersonii.AAC.1
MLPKSAAFEASAQHQLPLQTMSSHRRQGHWTRRAPIHRSGLAPAACCRHVGLCVQRASPAGASTAPPLFLDATRARYEQRMPPRREPNLKPAGARNGDNDEA